MDCSFILRNDIHEKYLLGRLDTEEKAAYKQHLDKCASCRHELERQSGLIAAIRAQAKRDMKREIKAQAEKLRTERAKQDRTVWYKAAAVILLFSVMPALLYYYMHRGRLPIEAESDTAYPVKEAIRTAPQFAPETDESISAEKAKPNNKQNTLRKSVKEKKVSKTELQPPAIQERSASQSALASASLGKRPDEADMDETPNKAIVSDLGEETAALSVSGAREKIGGVAPEAGLTDVQAKQYPVSYSLKKDTKAASRSVRKKITLAQADAQPNPVWTFESGNARIEIRLERSLADSLKNNFVLPVKLEYEITRKEEGFISMIWRGKGSYTRVSENLPHLILTAPNELEVIFGSRKYEIDLTRQKGQAVLAQ